jgi:hypothetical protein
MPPRSRRSPRNAILILAMSGAVIRAEAHEDLMFASHTQIEGDAEASAWATQRPQHRDAEEAGAETEWKLVARFDSLAERDIALKNGFVTVISRAARNSTTS